VHRVQTAEELNHFTEYLPEQPDALPSVFVNSMDKTRPPPARCHYYWFANITTSESVRQTADHLQQTVIYRCEAAQTCALPLLRDCDLEINHMTLKLEDDPDILKMSLHTENEAAGFRHSKLRAVTNVRDHIFGSGRNREQDSVSGLDSVSVPITSRQHQHQAVVIRVRKLPAPCVQQ